MIYKLTSCSQINRKDKRGKSNSYYLYFLNDVLILKHKIPYNTNWNHGCQHRTGIDDIYLLDGNIYQMRIDADETERHVKYPASKNILEKFNIPKGMKIIESDYNEIELDRIKKINSL
ncbi:hypothetical protein M0Q50_03315 [bacterium]|jgi:hypothetical protein|nr:hypothetical protein [bacterium]